MEETDLKQKIIPPIYFDRPNTFFSFDGTNYLPFQFKLGEEWFKRINRDATTNSQFNKFVFEHFSERRLLNTSTPNFLFGLADSPRVSIVANLKFRRLAFLRHRNIWVLKYHHDTNYNTFLSRLIGVRYIKLTKAQIQKIKTDLYDNDFNIAKFYEPTNLFNDNFYLKKKKRFCFQSNISSKF